MSETSGRELSGVKPVRKSLANGTIRTYFYHRDTMTRLPDDPNSDEFRRTVERLDRETARKEAEERGQTISTLIRLYQADPAWTGLAASTRTIETFNLRAIEDEFGAMPLSAVGEKGARAEFLAWRNDLAERTPRAADAKLKRLAKMFSFALDLELIDRHPLLKLKSVYESDRSDIVWTEAQIAGFRAVSGGEMAMAMLLALHTGQRRGDLLDLVWKSYDGSAIALEQSKTRAHVFIPCTRELKDALDERLDRLLAEGLNRGETECLTVLVNTEGKPWVRSAFRSAWDRAFAKSGIKEDIHFHDLRGTAVTRLAEAGCTVPEIATITGHSLSTVTKILERYLARSQTLSRSAIAKLQASLDGERPVRA